jgi:lysyl-tRNA synthetase, class II
MTKTTDSNNVSESSIESQREVRISKLSELRKVGQDPFAIYSFRDHTLGFVKFWFDFAHKVDVNILSAELTPYTVELLLYHVLFPKTLVERADELLNIRGGLKQIGVDPNTQSFEDFYDVKKITEMRELFPHLGEFNTEYRARYFSAFFRSVGNNFVTTTLSKNQNITLAGRVKALRYSGKIAFAVIEDESYPPGFQIILKLDALVKQNVHSLTKRNTKHSVLELIREGKKTIETRARSKGGVPTAYEKVVEGDLMCVYDTGESAPIYYRINRVTKHDNILDAFGAGLDFSKVFPDLKEGYTLQDVMNSYEKLVGKEYAIELQTGGMVSMELSYTRPTMSFNEIKDNIDVGDYIQVTGTLDYSQRGEPSLIANDFSILTKALRPLPDVLDYDNLEARYTDRVADFKMDTADSNGLSIRNIIRLKNRFWQIWREELSMRGFLEIEAPMMEHIPGGAEAEPFVTHYNALDTDMYLRISLELPLKKMIAGGFEKVFEIGRIFRNEGVSPQHLQEYTQVEWYWAYANYVDGMHFVQRVYRRICKEILGGELSIDLSGGSINWGSWYSGNEWDNIGGWPAIEYFDAIKYYSEDKINLEDADEDKLRTIAKKYNIKVDETDSYGRLLDLIYKKLARPNIKDPIFLIKPPVELEPLAKKDIINSKLTQRFQIVAGGAELGKGFSELNDPIDQLERFESQQKARDQGDKEAQFMDMEYVKALELGTPPIAGFGVSERLFSFLLGKNIKESVTFPHIRREE